MVVTCTLATENPFWDRMYRIAFIMSELTPISERIATIFPSPSPKTFCWITCAIIFIA